MMNPKQQAERTKDFLREVLPMDAESEVFIARAIERINTDGANQYYDAARNEMLFERLPLDALYTMVEEELLDAANYLYMIEVRGGPRLTNVAVDLFDVWWHLKSVRLYGDDDDDNDDEIITTEYEATHGM